MKMGINGGEVEEDWDKWGQGQLVSALLQLKKGRIVGYGVEDTVDLYYKAMSTILNNYLK